MADSTGQRLSFAQALIASVALAEKLKQRLNTEQNIGILIPSSVAGVLTNVAVSLLKKVPININFTTSPEAMASIIRQCEMRWIITSRAFLEKVPLKPQAELIFVEDLVKQIKAQDKILAAFKAFLWPGFLSQGLLFGWRKRDIEDLATIMFTSGSTGDPKGVMLTHANIASNLEGLYQVFHMEDKEILLGILPLFHSFGFTAIQWFPLISGAGVIYHGNPLDAKMVGRLVEKFKVTILMATPTFLNMYTQRCSKEQFKSLRVAVVGAEKLKESVARAFCDKFGIEPMEGYGCTELSPIVSLNLPDFRGKGPRQRSAKPGTIGMPLPGIAVRIVDLKTGETRGPDEEGLLLVKGPNIMKGYWRRAEATREVMREGWYVTGDMAKMDVDGFITITDRLSRFSKIGGEMVPHLRVEEAVHEILNVSEQVCVVTSIPDEKKGEQLAVLCLQDVDVSSVVEALRKSGLPRLWIPDPKNFLQVDAIPMLGTGKVDLGKVRRIALKTFQGGST